MRTLHLGLTLAACAATALVLGIELLAWPLLVTGSIASIWAFALLLQDAYEPPLPAPSRASHTTGRRALPSVRQPAS